MHALFKWIDTRDMLKLICEINMDTLFYARNLKYFEMEEVFWSKISILISSYLYEVYQLQFPKYMWAIAWAPLWGKKKSPFNRFTW